MAPPRTLTNNPLLCSESMSRRTVSAETFRVFARDPKLTFPFFPRVVRIWVCRSSFNISTDLLCDYLALHGSPMARKAADKVIYGRPGDRKFHRIGVAAIDQP